MILAGSAVSRSHLLTATMMGQPASLAQRIESADYGELELVEMMFSMSAEIVVAFVLVTSLLAITHLLLHGIIGSNH